MVGMSNVSMVLRAVKSVPKVASSKKGLGERYSEKLVPKKEYMVLPSIDEWQIECVTVPDRNRILFLRVFRAHH